MHVAKERHKQFHEGNVIVIISSYEKTDFKQFYNFL